MTKYTEGSISRKTGASRGTSPVGLVSGSACSGSFMGARLRGWMMQRMLRYMTVLGIVAAAGILLSGCSGLLDATSGLPSDLVGQGPTSLTSATSPEDQAAIQEKGGTITGAPPSMSVTSPYDFADAFGTGYLVQQSMFGATKENGAVVAWVTAEVTGGGHGYALQRVDLSVAQTTLVTVTWVMDYICAAPSFAIGPVGAGWNGIKAVSYVDDKMTDSQDIVPVIRIADLASKFSAAFSLNVKDVVGVAKTFLDIAKAAKILAMMKPAIDAGTAKRITCTFSFDAAPGIHQIEVGAHVAADSLGLAVNGAMLAGFVRSIVISAPAPVLAITGPDSVKENTSGSYTGRVKDGRVSIPETGGINVTDLCTWAVDSSAAKITKSGSRETAVATLAVGALSKDVAANATATLKWIWTRAKSMTISASKKVALKDAPAPLTLTKPNGGETLTPGSTYNITWTGAAQSALITLEYSTDSGKSWAKIAVDKANSGSYSWTIPNLPATTGRVRVTASGGPSDTSDANFVISQLPPQPLLPSGDAGIISNRPDQKGGSDSSMNCGRNPYISGATARALVRFGSLPVLPAGKTLQRATLRVYLDAVFTAGKLDVLPIAAPDWSEKTVTWNTGVKAASSPSASKSFGSGNEGTWLEVDVTQIVQQWYSGALPNRGFILSSSAGFVDIRTKEDLNGKKLQYAPQLVIAY